MRNEQSALVPLDAQTLRAQIERDRELIARASAVLRDELGRVGDWREWVRRRPATSLLAAAGIGFLLGYRLRSRR